MPQKDDLRQNIIGSIILLYFLPLLLLCGYAVKWISLQSSWGLLGIGLAAVVAGSIALITKIWQWESLLLEQVDVLADSKAAFLLERQPTTSSSHSQSLTRSLENLEEQSPPPSEFEVPIPPQEQVEHLNQELNEKDLQYTQALEHIRMTTQDMQNLQNEREGLQKQLEQLRQELFITQQTSRDQIKQKDQQIFEYSQTINDLRSSMEKKQQQVVKLESSVRDLTYEVKTLLQISDIEEPTQPPLPLPVQDVRAPTSPFETLSKSSPYSIDRPTNASPYPQDAFLQLKRCIDTAQKLTGANYLGISSRFRDMPLNSYALEQRRLFDSLQSENSNLILVYSQKEDKLLFANNQTKTLLGWSPEKFIQDFPALVQTSLVDWKKALSSLSTAPEAQTRLLIKSRAGIEQPFNCLIGTIPTGIFKNHSIAIIYP